MAGNPHTGRAIRNMAYQAFATVYDRLMADAPYDQWLHFALKFWEQRGFRPDTVADLGCGTGNLAIPLAQRGYNVIGIDLSEDMLACAQEKLSHLPAMPGSVLYIQQDMREWELGFRTDAVISFCDCLNYLTEPDDILQTFVQTFRGLNEGGWFLFDMHPPSTLRSYGEQQPFVLQEPDISYVWTCDWNEERLEIVHDLSIFVQAADGRYDRIDEWQVQRAYEREWILGALREAGFEKAECFADFTMEPPGPDARRWFFAARKPA